MIGNGLSSSEALLKQKKFGFNILPEERPESDLRIFLAQLQNPLVYVLLLASAVTFFLGDLPNSGIILLAVFINTVLGFYQERKAKKAILALRKLLTPKTRVKRNGRIQILDASDLVHGDIVLLTRGDKIPADALVIESKNLFVDESIITGESLPVGKKKGNEVLMGSIVAGGQAEIEIVRIGLATEVGKIADKLKTKEEQTPLEKRLHTLSRHLAIFVGLTALVIFIVGLSGGRPLVEIFIISVALAVSAIPEGLVVALTVILVIGMQRILKRKALVRRLLAAETLGSVNVICVDKTGTITEGKLKVVQEEFSDRQKGIRAAVLANDLEDPLEVVRWDYVLGQDHFDPQKIFDESSRIDSLPFSPETKFLATLHEREVFISGAPELLLEWSGLTFQEKKVWKEKIDQSANRGLRLVGFAWRPRKKNEIKLKTETVRENLSFLGFLAFSDPVRKEVKEALILAQRAGVKVKIITGDYRLTAEAVLKEIGFEINSPSIQILEGEELEKISDNDLKKRIDDVILFVRTKPFDKLRIVEILKSNGQVVAMTGDGINDALALQKADIGIVVQGASEVAKETADVILLDANFSTIVAAIEEGRGIFDNLRKIVLYLLSDAFGEILIILGALIAGWPLALTAGQILWINLVSDGFPSLALTVDPKRRGLMEEGPVTHKEDLINREIKVLITLVSLFSGISALFIFGYFLGQTQDLAYARSMAFAVLGVNSLFYVFSCRSLKQPVWQTNLLSNFWLILGVLAGFLLLFSAFYFAPVVSLLETVSLGIFEWGLVMATGLAVVALVEGMKFVFMLKSKHG